METTIRKTTYHIFDSVEELIEAVQSVDEQRCEQYQPSPDRESFIGRDLAGWEAAYQAAREPWAEGLDVLDRMLRDLDEATLPKPTSRRRRTRFAEDDGDELDYDRLRSGRAFWRTSRRQNTRGPATITILVDVGANCSTNHLDILWRGAAAVAMTEKLEAAGYRVELWLVDRSVGVWRKSSNNRFDRDGVTAVCLKRPGDPLDTSTLISAVSGWFYRSVMFRAFCLGCPGTFEVKPSLGRAFPPTEQDLDQITPDRKRVLIAKAFTYQAAVNQVREKLNQLTAN